MHKVHELVRIANDTVRQSLDRGHGCRRSVLRQEPRRSQGKIWSAWAQNIWMMQQRVECVDGTTTVRSYRNVLNVQLGE